MGNRDFNGQLKLSAGSNPNSAVQLASGLARVFRNTEGNNPYYVQERPPDDGRLLGLRYRKLGAIGGQQDEGELLYIEARHEYADSTLDSDQTVVEIPWVEYQRESGAMVDIGTYHVSHRVTSSDSAGGIDDDPCVYSDRFVPVMALGPNGTNKLEAGRARALQNDIVRIDAQEEWNATDGMA